MAAPPIITLKPEFQQLLGAIVESWAYVDGTVNEMLSFMCEADPGSMYAITQNVSASSVSTWVRTLVEVRLPDDPNRQVILDLLSEIDRLRSERNAVVHGFWTMESGGEAAIVQTFKWDRREIAKHDLMTRADMEDLLTRVNEVRWRIGRLGQIMGFITT